MCYYVLIQAPLCDTATALNSAAQNIVTTPKFIAYIQVSCAARGTSTIIAGTLPPCLQDARAQVLNFSDHFRGGRLHVTNDRPLLVQRQREELLTQIPIQHVLRTRERHTPPPAPSRPAHFHGLVRRAERQVLAASQQRHLNSQTPLQRNEKIGVRAVL